MILEVSQLTKTYKNGRGIENITFSLNKGEVFGLLGPNGSGKTTTMKAIVGLIRVNAGCVSVLGFDALSGHESCMRHTGALIEAPALFEYMSAYNNLRFAARFRPELPDGRIMETLELCGLVKYKKDRVSTFSLGMRQRLGLAIALLSKPSLLILDEPANGLDIEGMITVREIITQTAAEGAAVLVSSHLAHEIEQCAGRVGIMHEGELLSDVPLEAALENNPSLEDFYLSEVTRHRKERLS